MARPPDHEEDQSDWIDGLTRTFDPDTPLIVLTSRADELHRIRALDRGGDDVLTKPFSYPELRAPIGALLRRAEARRAPRVFRAGELTIDVAARNAGVGEHRLELPAKEYELLRTLASEPTRVFTRQELLRLVWGQAYGTSRTLDSHACRLRRWLVDAGARAAGQYLGSRLPTHRPDADVVAARGRPDGRSQGGRW